MTFCFLDPVFFTLNSEFTLKHFKSEIFPVLSELEEKISEIEENLRERKVFFNICQEIIYDAMNFNPFQFETNDSVKIYFERFLLKFLAQHRNNSCDKRSNNKSKINKIKYNNKYVPIHILDMWNEYLNDCNNCTICNNEFKDILTINNYGIEMDENSIIFFTKLYNNIMNWITERVKINNPYIIPPISEKTIEQKKKPKWKHSHTNYIKNRIYKLIKCDYVDFIEPVSKTRGVNYDLIKIKNIDLLEVYLSEGDGAEIFILRITARNFNETDFIIKKLVEIIPNFKIKD